jgi:hypothetical protein
MRRQRAVVVEVVVEAVVDAAPGHPTIAGKQRFANDDLH